MIRRVGGSLKKKGSSRQNRPPNSIFTQGNFFENKEMYEQEKKL